jgi:hypothetical protein
MIPDEDGDVRCASTSHPLCNKSLSQTERKAITGNGIMTCNARHRCIVHACMSVSVAMGQQQRNEQRNEKHLP